jgi:hypothetical protein
MMEIYWDNEQSVARQSLLQIKKNKQSTKVLNKTELLIWIKVGSTFN